MDEDNNGQSFKSIPEWIPRTETVACHNYFGLNDRPFAPKNT